MEIQRPDDPYTTELEGNLSVSDYWDFESGLTPFFPAGLGMELQLDAGTRLDFQLGYHQPLTQLGSYGDSFQKGYLGLNIGIRFGSTVREPSTAPDTGPPVLPLSFQSIPQVSALVPDLPVFPEFRLEAGNVEKVDPTPKIATIVNDERRSAGRNQENWRVGRLASGVYFYRMVAEGVNGSRFVKVKQMTLLK